MYGGNPYGHLHGHINDEDGTITGDNISYIYPDMETVLLGRFENRLMRNAQESAVIEVDCDVNGMLYVSKYKNRDFSSPKFFYEPPTNISFGGGPKHVYDPYEKKLLEVKKCKDTKVGEGVFTKRDIKKGVIVASYTGFIYGKNNGERLIYLKSCEKNWTKTYEERSQCGKYTMLLKERDAYIDIPPEHDQPDIFLPSMGPKVSFRCLLSLKFVLS